MKKIYLTLLSLIGIGGAYAQAPIFSSGFETWNTVSDILNKDFEDGSITSGSWTTVQVTGTDMPWVYGYTGGKYAKASGYIGGSNKATEAWYISPAINLASATAPTLNFKNATKYTGAAMEVFVSTNYSSGAPSTATWSSLTFTASSGNFDWVSSGAIDLTSNKSATTRIAFKYTSTTSSASSWEVDDIVIAEAGSGPKITGWFGSKTSIAASAVTEVTGKTGKGAKLTNTATSAVKFSSQPFSIKKDTIYKIRYSFKGSGEIQTSLYTGGTADNGIITAGYYNDIYQPSDFWGYTDYIKADMTTNSAELVLWVKGTSGDAILDDIEITPVVDPAIPALRSIYDIQYTTNSYGDSPMKDDYYKVGGVITAIANPKIYDNYTARAFYGFYMQDGFGMWRGVFVNLPDSTTLSGFAQGDSVVVSGVVREVSSLTKIVSVTDIAKISQGNTLPKAFFTSANTVFRKTTGEALEGVLVQIPNVNCETSYSLYDEWTVKDVGADSTLTIDTDCFVDKSFTPAVGTKYDVTGVVTSSYGGSTVKDRFTLNPRSAADVSLASGIADNVKTKVSVYPNPAHSTLSVKGINANASVRIFDVTGKNVMNKNVTVASNDVNVSNLVNGVYVVEINNGNSTEFLKFIKE